MSDATRMDDRRLSGRAAPHRQTGERDRQLDQSFQHKLEQFDLGMVWLDAQNRITAFNDVALQILGPTAEASLGIARGDLLGLDVVAMHPPRSREKIEFLLRMDDQGGTPANAPPLAMMINIPDRLLMIKVSRMLCGGDVAGTCMVFFDLTDVATTPSGRTERAGVPAPRQISRVPDYRRDRIMLIDVKDIIRFEGDGHYTSLVTAEERYLCNLSISVLEARLPAEQFLRVHRSHIINLDFASELVRADDGVLVVMQQDPGNAVPVSKHKLRRLKDCFGLD